MNKPRVKVFQCPLILVEVAVLFGMHGFDSSPVPVFGSVSLVVARGLEDGAEKAHMWCLFRRRSIRR